MELLHVNIPSWSDLWVHWRPELMLVITFLVALLSDLVVRGRRPAVPFTVSLVGLVASGVVAV